MAAESEDFNDDDLDESSEARDAQEQKELVNSSQSNKEKNATKSDLDDEKSDKRQLGPRIDRDLADDWKFIIRQLHDGKYKGRLSDEVANALKLYMGKVVNDQAMLIDESKNQAQANRLQQYAEEHREACSSVSVESQLTEELAEMREEIEDLNSHNTRMLSQIVTQLDS